MTKLRKIITLSVIAIALALISYWVGKQSYSWFPPEASVEAKLIDDLFSFLTAVGTFIFLGVSGALLYSALFQRAGKYDFSDGPSIEGNTTLEIVWTVIPIILVIWIATNSFQIYDKMALLGPMQHIHIGKKESDVPPKVNPDAVPRGVDIEEVEVIARQWSWEFRYPKQNVSSTELHLPSDRRVRLALRSEDVLHGFYVPAFRLKQDIVPNRPIYFEMTPILPGKYRLRDSQFSGTYFAAMQTDVVVEPLETYQQWLVDAAKRTPVAAFNAAYSEYNQSVRRPLSPGWKTLPPAPPPVVNYTTSYSSPDPSSKDEPS